MLSALHSTFNVHSDDIQDMAMNYVRSIGTCILIVIVQHSPQDSGSAQVPGPSVPGPQVPGPVRVYSLPILLELVIVWL